MVVIFHHQPSTPFPHPHLPSPTFHPAPVFAIPLRTTGGKHVVAISHRPPHPHLSSPPHHSSINPHLLPHRCGSPASGLTALAALAALAASAALEALAALAAFVSLRRGGSGGGHLHGHRRGGVGRPGHGRKSKDGRGGMGRRPKVFP